MLRVTYFTNASGRSPVKDFILDQDVKARNKILEVVTYFEEHGFHLPTTYLRRISGSQALWELRAKYHSVQYRIFLARVSDNMNVLLHVIIKKTQKTPPKEIKTAEERLRQYR